MNIPFLPCRTELKLLLAKSYHTKIIVIQNVKKIMTLYQESFLGQNLLID